MSFIQTSIEKVDFDLLNSKLPILIEDRIVNVKDIFDSILKYQYTFISEVSINNQWIKNNSKYVIVVPNQKTIIKISHPSSNLKSGKYEYIDIILNHHQIVILPFGWWILTNSDCIYYKLDDILSKLLSFVV